VRYGIGHIIDLLPTVLEAADIEFPSLFRGRQPVRPDGESLMEMMKGADALARPFFYEHQGSRAVYHEGWKLVADGINQPWELFNLIEDLTEQKDLGKQFPELVSKLKQLWEDWAEQNNVLPLQEGGPMERLRNQRSTEQSGK
tara:strand:- start:171 stop:599 length:429 start_codon:yes stop_codon:yes gene_type:complete